ncbi:hypothetical protein GDO81_004880 [Engystomops pustulosus]|uniref:PHD-type domain-containing protein n=1 Tax=Engystomops pustulosus TaxID=76066 RepID=A0AAV7CJ40_ENGPU|nr:hypothetical protein GDO81_004880 [Engystomops pustulosus]
MATDRRSPMTSRIAGGDRRENTSTDRGCYRGGSCSTEETDTDMSSTADTAMSPPDTCAFCKMSGEIVNVAGVLERSPDGRVVAHKNCMLYSPKVIMKDPRECGKFRYDIESVVSEIKRGKELPCNRCRKRGATVGCDVKECRRTYHFPCVQEARGSVNRNRFVVFCFEHNNNNANGPKKGQKSRKRKRCQKPSDNLRKKIKKQNCNNGVLQNVQDNEQPESSFIIPSNFTVDIEDREVAQPSTSWQCMRSGSVSEESDSLLSPRVNTMFSLGVLQNEQTNEQPETILFIPIHSTVEIEDSEDAQPSTSRQCMRPDSSSEESDSLLSPRVKTNFSPRSQQNLDIEINAAEKNENDQMIREDANDSDVTENSTDSSDTDSTLDGQTDDMPVNALDRSTEENPFPREQPLISQDNKILTNTSKSPAPIDILASRLGMKAQAQFSESNTRNRSCMRTPDTSSHSSNGKPIPETQSSEVSNGVMNFVSPDTENMFNDISSPSHLIQSSNTKEKLASDLHNVPVAEDFESQETSEVGPAGSPVTEYEVTSYTPTTQEKDGNREEAYTSVSDRTSLEIMQDSTSKSHCYNREFLAAAGTSGVKTFQNEKGGENKRSISNEENKRSISTIVSPQQITAISRKLVRGDLFNQFKAIVPQIQSAINSPKGYKAKEAEHSRDDDPIQKMDLMCKEKSKSPTSKRQLCYEPLTTTNLQQTEENLSEQPEIPEDLDEHRDEELQEEAAPPGSIQVCVSQRKEKPMLGDVFSSMITRPVPEGSQAPTAHEPGHSSPLPPVLGSIETKMKSTP